MMELPNLPAPRENYVSVFDNPDRFDHCYRMAEILADSLFVPGGSSNRPNESFRGNPANCLIALDLAGRLGLAPTALFPHLYVINGRPALSSQFVIALVNRSGLFSRISWEEGIDGEVSFEAYGRQRTLPNYTAIAKFTEIKTGIEYRSTVVSLELARRNGWLVKNESKWQTIPQEMCRWRSAAWLAKNFAPELIFGLEFAEEVRDADATAPIDVAVRPTRSISPARLSAPVDDPDQPTLEDDLRSGIESASNEAELAAIADEIGRADGLTPTAKQRLRDAFRSRRIEIAKAAVETVTNKPESAQTPAPKAEEPAKPRKRRAAAKKPETDPEAESALVAAIRSAKTKEELERVANAINDSVSAGDVDEKAYETLTACIEAKASELERAREEAGAADPSSEPTDRQVRNYNELRDGIDSAQDLDGLKRCVEFVDDAKARDLVTPAQAKELYEHIDLCGKRFLV